MNATRGYWRLFGVLISLFGAAACVKFPVETVTKKPSTSISTVTLSSVDLQKVYVRDYGLADYVLPNADVRAFEAEFLDDGKSLLGVLASPVPGRSIVADHNQVVLAILFPEGKKSDELDRANVHVFYQPEQGLKYVVSADDALTGVHLDLKADGERVVGNYEATVCLEDAVVAGKCADERNVRKIAGRFDVLRDPKRILENQGSAEQPIFLGASPLKRTDLFVADGASYYRVGLLKNHRYRIGSVEMESNLEIHTYLDAKFESEICAVTTNTVQENASCIVETGAFETVYVKVLNEQGVNIAGAQFGIAVDDVGAFAAQGSTEKPIDLGNVPRVKKFNGTVAAGKASYYVAKLYPKQINTVTLKNLTGTFPLQMEVLEPGNILCLTNFQCMARAEKGVFYIVVSSTDNDAGAAFDVTIEEIGGVTEFEGTLEAPLPVGGDTINGKTGNYARSSFYRVSVDENTKYEIAFPDHQDDMVVNVLDNAQATDKLCNFAFRCTASSKDGDGTLLLNVVTLRPEGARFVLNVKKIPVFVSEGSAAAPLDVSEKVANTGGFDGQMKGVGSYYRFPLEKDKVYTFNFSDVTDADMGFSVLVNGTNVCKAGFVAHKVKRCSALITADSVDVVAKSASFFVYAEGGFHFTLENGGLAYQSSGTQAVPTELGKTLPVELVGEQTDINYHYYNLSVTEGEQISAAISEMAGDNADLWVTAGNEYCTSNRPGNTADSCSVTIPAGISTAQVIVGGIYVASGSSYTLRVYK